MTTKTKTKKRATKASLFDHDKKQVTSKDCQSCGMCCTADYYKQEKHVALLTEDLLKLPAAFKKKYVDDDGYITTVQNEDDVTVCPALKGTLKQSCSCGIYAKRPYICREFEPGSAACRYARRLRKQPTELPSIYTIL